MHLKLSQLTFLFQIPNRGLKHFEKQLKMKHLDAETKRNSLYRAEALKVIRMLSINCLKKKVKPAIKWSDDN